MLIEFAKHCEYGPVPEHEHQSCEGFAIFWTHGVVGADRAEQHAVRLHHPELQQCAGDRVDARGHGGDLVTDGAGLFPDPVADEDGAASATDGEQSPEQGMDDLESPKIPAPWRTQSVDERSSAHAPPPQ